MEAADSAVGDSAVEGVAGWAVAALAEPGAEAEGSAAEDGAEEDLAAVAAEGQGLADVAGSEAEVPGLEEALVATPTAAAEAQHCAKCPALWSSKQRRLRSQSRSRQQTRRRWHSRSTTQRL
jgi:hypothetical protein